MDHYLHRYVYQLSLRACIRCGEFIRTDYQCAGGWDTQVTVTSPEDIGRLTTDIYLHQPRIANEVVFVAGETTSYGELAETVERGHNKPL
jgi:hypothetical protein